MKTNFQGFPWFLEFLGTLLRTDVHVVWPHSLQQCGMTPFSPAMWHDPILSSNVAWPHSLQQCGMTPFSPAMWHDPILSSNVAWPHSLQQCGMTPFSPAMWYDLILPSNVVWPHSLQQCSMTPFSQVKWYDPHSPQQGGITPFSPALAESHMDQRYGTTCLSRDPLAGRHPTWPSTIYPPNLSRVLYTLDPRH